MAIKTNETFGARMRQALEVAGMSQSELARAIGAATPTVNNWTKRTEAPDGDACERIAGALKVRADWLRTGVGARRA